MSHFVNVVPSPASSLPENVEALTVKSEGGVYADSDYENNYSLSRMSSFDNGAAYIKIKGARSGLGADAVYIDTGAVDGIVEALLALKAAAARAA
jgi:hypothetical protein